LASDKHNTGEDDEQRIDKERMPDASGASSSFHDLPRCAIFVEFVIRH